MAFGGIINLNQNRERGFTLLEILLVIAIIAVLSVVVVLVLNPNELLKQARDSRRLSDIQTLNRAITVYQAEFQNGFGNANTVYVSIPDDSGVCNNTSTYLLFGLPQIPSSTTGGYRCSSLNNYLKVDNNGWVPINFAAFSSGSPLERLPFDSVNKATNALYYAYVSSGGNTWALATRLESDKYLKQVAQNDGGTDSARFEKGTDLLLWARASGLQSFLRLDEAGGSTANDSSGNGINGTLACYGSGCSNPQWASGKVGMSLFFNPLSGNGQYVTLSSGFVVPSANNAAFSVEFWYKPTAFGANTFIIDQKGPSNNGISIQKNTSDAVQFISGNGSGNNTTLTFGTYGTGSDWHHLVVAYDGSTVRLYADGALVTSAASQVITSPAGFFTLGKRAGQNAGPFYGYLDEVQVYGRALSDAEVLASYNAMK